LAKLDVRGAELDEPLAEGKSLRVGCAVLLRASAILELRALQAEQPLTLREVEQSVPREQPKRRRKAREISRREYHDSETGRKRAPSGLPNLREPGDIYG